MSQRLNGRVAIVTGGGHGIGRAYVKRLAEEGAKVAIAEIDVKAANAVAEELSADGFDVLAVHTDVTSPDDKIRQRRASAASDRAIPRLQMPEDMLGAVVFFSSSHSDFITGQTLVVDGGSCKH